MKNTLLLLTAVLLSCPLLAQDYNVTFSAYAIDTPTDQVDSIQVENITQGKTITVNGDDTLHLVDVVQNIDQQHTGNQLSVYPNPASGYAFVEFWNDGSDDAQFFVYDMAGRKIISQSLDVTCGTNTYKLTGLSRGNYVVSMVTENLQLSETLNTTGNPGASMQIVPVSASETEETLKKKNTRAGTLVDWQYDEDDILIFKAWGEGYSRIYVYNITDDNHLTVFFEDCVDTDGNKYTVVEIVGTIWMAENLRTSKYNNNVPIPNIPDQATWIDLTTGGRCYCAYDSASYASTYGALYNFAAVNSGNLCPTGWHVPSKTEFEDMIIALQNNEYNYDGSVDDDNDYTTNNKTAKALCSTSSWKSSTTEGVPGNEDYPSYRNRSGFSVIAAGENAGFEEEEADFWSSTELGADNVASLDLVYYLEDAQLSSSVKISGLSVRCVKD
ncbi:MAG: FISUMP domain-containing protein [Candidatus Delongbacteria bacterium]|nr:FISUMP domain-containing protein [Candidatus Delongbacteria bacterium]